MKNLILALSIFSASGLASAAPVPDQCGSLLSELNGTKGDYTSDVAWGMSEKTIEAIRHAVSGSDAFLHNLLTASLANEFAWVNGDPGGAKTYLSRMVFKAQLNALKEPDKKIFLLQFHKLMTEGVITGFPKIKSMLDHGKYEIESSSALVGDKFIFTILDEAEKANPATLTALLSVLNERKAFLGSKVVDAMLSSGVITSNKTMAEFIQTSGDRPSFEALADRMATKRHVPNQFGSAAELVGMYNNVKSGTATDDLILPLKSLQSLVAKVTLTGQVEKIATLIMNMDALFTTQADQTLAAMRRGEDVPEYFPANQFSNRSVGRILKTMKASLVARQLMDGVPYNQVRLTMNDGDLVHVATAALYGGPSQVHLKRFKLEGVQVRGHYGEPVPVDVEWSPYDQKVFFYDRVKFRSYAATVQNGALVPSAELAAAGIDLTSDLTSEILKQGKEYANLHQIDVSKPQFEVDGEIARLLAKKTIPARTRHELDTIEKDMQLFAAQLNAITTVKNEAGASQPNVVAELQQQKKRIEDENVKMAEVLERARTSNLSGEQKLATYYQATQTAFNHLKTMYPELDYAAQAYFVAVLARSHLYIFGPPGGAKTSMAREILGSLLRWENMNAPARTDAELRKFTQEFASELAAKDKKAAKLFFLQFHKLVPEGVIVGFPKLQSQIDSGKLEFDLSNSLANEEFVFAILDEVEKGNPAVLTTLLSVLNEREVFAGNNVFKTGLRVAALTSNKMPSEFLDYFEDDRPTGTALLDRTLNKVYVSNKFSSKETLVKFIHQMEAGLSPKMSMPLPIEELKPLVNKVEVDDYLKHVMAEIYDDFNGRRLEKEEKSQKAHREDAAEFPDYYIKATSGSNRTFNAILDQVRAAFIVQQLVEGVPFNELRHSFEVRDLPTFFKGLAYWTPVKIASEYDQNGFLKFTLSGSTLEKLKDAPYVNQRSRYMLGAMFEEAQDFVDVANNRVSQLLLNYRQVIAKFPNLFPSLFANDQARNQFLQKQGNSK